MRFSRKKPKHHQKKEVFYRTNEQIRVPEVRVIDEEGKMIGVMETAQALQIAREKGLDLVEVYPKAEPPVAKIMDYGKLQYQKQKQAQKQKAQQKKGETKIIKLSFRIGRHDLNLRKEQAQKFLEEGNKVKVELVLKGREKQHKDFAEKIITDFLNSLKEETNIKFEQTVKYKGNSFTAIILKG